MSSVRAQNNGVAAFEVKSFGTLISPAVRALQVHWSELDTEDMDKSVERGDRALDGSKNALNISTPHKVLVEGSTGGCQRRARTPRIRGVRK